jgi:hypothetical protein
MGVCMSKFISLRILASLSKSKKAAMRETPRTPPAAEVAAEPSAREEPGSSSRISVNRIRIEG